LRSQCAGAGTVGSVREFRHGAQQILSRADQVEFALQIRDFCLQSAALVVRGAGQRGLGGLQLRLRGLLLRIELLLVLAQRLRRRGRAAGSNCRGLIRQNRGVRPGNVERQAHGLRSRLPNVVQNQQIARLGGGLLLNGERPEPIHGLIQYGDDLRRRHRSCGLRSRRSWRSTGHNDG